MAESESAVSASCDYDMLPVFEKSYHKFFDVNGCKNCHSSTGVAGIPHFGDPDSSIGLSVFMTIGPDRIETKIKTGHQGYAYTNFETELSAYKQEWTEALKASSCTGNAFTSSGKNILFFEPHVTYPDVNVVKTTMLDWQTLSWSLDNKNDKVTDGVEMSIDVKIVNTGGERVPQYYLVDNLRIKTSQHSLRVKGVYVMLNDKTYFVTTYKTVDEVVAVGPDFQNLAHGSAAAIFVKDPGEKYQNADRWSIQIEVLEAK